MPEAMEAFESWLVHRVAQVVEAGEVSADLLAELRREIEQTRDLSQAEGHTLAVQDIAERVGLPVDRVEMLLSAIEAQPSVTRQLLICQFVEEWLAKQRELYAPREDGD